MGRERGWKRKGGKGWIQGLEWGCMGGMA